MHNSEQKPTIKTLAENERPREKLIHQGRRQLSDAELLAILISSGSYGETAIELSQRILYAYQHSLSKLGRASVKELQQFRGIGEAKAISIVAALELGRRRKEETPGKSPTISCSRDAFEILQPVLSDLQHEEFWLLMLNASNGVIGKAMISKGGRAGTIADPKIIFKTAMDYEASYLILAHNHPSGSLNPSEEDLRITKKLVNAGKMLDLFILDHLIVTSEGFLSLADEGMM